MDSFEILIDEPGHAVALINGELHTLNWSDLEDSDLPAIIADAINFDAIN